jgi:hypothetical protein
MTDGDDTRPETDGEYPEDSMPQTTDSGTAGMSGIDEGWGAGEATIDEVVENVRKFFELFKGEILTAWIVYAAASLVLETIDIGIQSIAALLGGGGAVFAIVMLPVMILVGLAYPLITAGQLTLYGPMRDRVFHGTEPSGWRPAIEQGLSRFWPVLGAMLLIGIIIPLGCIFLGLVIAFFAIMAPYYLATRASMAFVDAFKKSYEMAKKYWDIFAITIGALLAAGLLFGCIFSCGWALDAAPEPLATIFGGYATWLAATVFQFGIFVVWGGVFTTVDAHETGEEFELPGSESGRGASGSGGSPGASEI